MQLQSLQLYTGLWQCGGGEVWWEMRGEAEHVGMNGTKMSLTYIGTTS